MGRLLSGLRRLKSSLQPFSHGATATEFQYEKLENGTSFRILSIQPGSLDAKLILSLTHYNFRNEVPPYEALSYVWGDSPKDVPISINEMPFKVSRNLHPAILQLRNKDEPRRVWIDAICVDQENLLERGEQVLLMKKIYSGASNVIIWTGMEDDSARGAFELVRDILKFIDNNGARVLSVKDSVTRDSIHRLFLNSESFGNTLDKALDFLRNPWFTRVWTFQEVFLSCRAEILSGNIKISWDKFIFCWSYLSSIGFDKWDHDHGSVRTVFATYTWANMNREVSSKEEPLRLSNLLRSTYQHKSTDPRDKIFGLLAMVSPRDNIQYVADYTKDVDEIYIAYAILMIWDDGHLQILSDNNRTKDGLKLPSWVPDWRGFPNKHPLAERIRDFPQQYHAGAGLANIYSFEATTSHSSRKLHLQGAILDTISAQFSLVNLPRKAPSSFQWRSVFTAYHLFYIRIKRFLRLSNSTSLFPDIYAPTGENHLTAFIRTLAADALPISRRRDRQNLAESFPEHYKLARTGWTGMLLPGSFTDDSTSSAASVDITSGGPIAELYTMLFSGAVYTAPDGSDGLSPWQRISAQEISKLAGEIIKSVTVTAERRAVFFTEKGRMGIGPEMMQQGDRIAGFVGGDVLFVVRKAGEAEWELLGDAYIHGFMDGEIWKGRERDIGEVILV